jgi:hypothetical protein
MAHQWLTAEVTCSSRWFSDDLTRLCRDDALESLLHVVVSCLLKCRSRRSRKMLCACRAILMRYSRSQSFSGDNTFDLKDRVVAHVLIPSHNARVNPKSSMRRFPNNLLIQRLLNDTSDNKPLTSPCTVHRIKVVALCCLPPCG